MVARRTHRLGRYFFTSQSCANLLPLSVELEGVKDGWSLLPQVPQMNTVVSQSTHQRSLSSQKWHFHYNSQINIQEKAFK